MKHRYHWCIKIFFHSKFRQSSALLILRERRPERGEFLTKMTKRLIHDLTESCFSLRVAVSLPPPPQGETEGTGRLCKPDANRVQ